MPLEGYRDYVEQITNPKQRLQDIKLSSTTVAYRFYSLWRITPDGGAIPTVPIVCTRDTPGAIFLRSSPKPQRIIQIVCSLQQSGYMVISDRLCQQGGLNGNTTDVQTTNLPTADLTRYTDGVGVFMSLDIYASIGTVASLATVTYIDDKDEEKISPPILIGSVSHNITGRSINVPLATGSKGVKKVLSVQLDTETGVIGNFGVTLYKPLFTMSIPNIGSQQFMFDPILGGCGNMPEVENAACLFYQVRAFTSSTGAWMSSIRVMEE